MHDSPKTGRFAASGWLRRQLKSPGYRFAGSASVYAFMQRVGVVTNDSWMVAMTLRERRVSRLPSQ